jgi:hypothetical protein
VDLGGVLGAVLIFCPIADVGSAKVVGDLGGSTSRGLCWVGFGLGVFALLEFSDSFANALGNVDERLVLVCILHDAFEKFDRSFRSKERTLDFDAVSAGG